MKNLKKLTTASALVLLLAACGQDSDEVEEVQDETGRSDVIESTDEVEPDEESQEQSEMDDEEGEATPDQNDASNFDEEFQGEGVAKFERDDGGIHSVFTYEYEDDVALSVKQEHIGNMDELDLTQEDVEAELGQIGTQYEDVDGVEYDLSFEEDTFIQTLEIDYNEVDFQEVAALESESLEGTDDQIDYTHAYVSMSSSKEELINQGFTEVEE